MTSHDAAALAVLSLSHRRFVTTLIRALIGRATAEDLDALPPREAGEGVPAWACRCIAPRDDPSRGQQECAQLTETACRQIERAASLGIRAVPIGTAEYPRLLAVINDPPPLIWVRGQHTACAAPAVAVVGSRAATPYGLAMARRIAAGLAGAGVVVISGLARGIDAAVHEAVLAAGGRTIAVQGCGLDRVYPAEHGELACRIEQGGAVISELPPGVPPLPHHFPLRNRIISGMSLAVVVVEAAEKSGALITASMAAEQGRDVMVVPGPATSGRNRGGHLLIRDGARVVETAADVLEELSGVGAAPPVASAPTLQLPETADFTVDDVAARTGEAPGVALARLLDLELAGRIQRIGGGRFTRVLT